MADVPFPTLAAANEVDLNATPAVVVWAGAGDQARQLHQVTFDVHFNAASKAAFFKLQVPVKLKDFPHEKTPLFLYIHPDRVTSLICEGPDKTPDNIRQKLDTDAVVCFRFNLNKPADLIVPRASSLAPRKQKGHGDTLDTLKLLAQETCLSVYLAHHDSLSEVLLQSLVATVADGSLQAFDGAADITELYSGKGGEVFQVGEPFPPPSYNQVGVAPPPLPFSEKSPAQASSSRKRRRYSASDTTEDGPSKMAPSMEAICRKMMLDMMSQFRHEERTYLKNELQQIKKEITEYVDKRLDRVADELDVYSVEQVDERIEEVRQYNEDRIDIKVEDRVDYVKFELEDYVEDHLAGAEERVMNRLRSASLCLEIQDD
ncbi:hypothetical protein VP1G_06438 [Cytospora mali]|uniref:Uncharacterized protein n=1 Tax=Cytospora mali TaxID=578113 RepID=A0A194V5P8_CYTMA|nr:hypothetical protein VP1G_06438 [Valsa mali var. pyri (nom. inval.)]